jgi:hypothetical protein
MAEQADMTKQYLDARDIRDRHLRHLNEIGARIGNIAKHLQGKQVGVVIAAAHDTLNPPPHITPTLRTNPDEWVSFDSLRAALKSYYDAESAVNRLYDQLDPRLRSSL